MPAPLDDQLTPRVHPERGRPLRAEVILVGNDLLRGRIADRNVRPIADAITLLGGTVGRVTAVSHAIDCVAEALREALARNPHLVILCGGLGPGSNDRTVEAAAQVLAKPLSPSAAARKLIEQAYARMQRSRILDTGGLDRLREKPCNLPVGATPLANPAGVTPGVLCKLPGGSAVLCLPGRPEEMRAVLANGLAELKELAQPHHVAQQEVETPTADEASLRPLIERLSEEFPQVALHTRPVGSGRRGSKVLVVLEATAGSESEAADRVDEALRRLLAIVGGGG